MATQKMAFDGGKKAGIMIGRREIRTEVLTYLEGKYSDVVRGSERGETILEITRELSKLMKVSD